MVDEISKENRVDSIDDLINLQRRVEELEEENKYLKERLQMQEVQWEEELKMLRADIEMKSKLIEQYRTTSYSDRTIEERCKILQSLNTKLKEDKQRLELQLLKVTSELTARTDEFRKSICEMKEETGKSLLYFIRKKF